MNRVLVLNAERRQGLAAIRSLGRQGLSITAMSDRRIIAGRLSRYADRFVRYPNPRDHEVAFVETLTDELRSRNYDMLLAGNNQTVLPVVKHRDQLESYTTVPHPDFETLWCGIDKRETMNRAREAGVPHPTTLAPTELSLETVEATFEYPVVLKPRVAAGRRGVSVCGSRDALEAAYEPTRRRHGPLLIQEFVPNGGECGVYALCDESSAPVAHLVQRRLRTNPPEGGAGTYRETIDHPELVSIADTLLSALGWCGLAHVEFRIDPRDSTPKLIEINPHPWHSLPHAVAAGVDFPYLLYQLAVCGTCETHEYRAGVRSQWLIGEIAHVLASNDKPTAAREVIETALTTRTFDIASVTDPLPMVGDVLGEGVQFIRRRLPGQTTGQKSVHPRLR